MKLQSITGVKIIDAIIIGFPIIIGTLIVITIIEYQQYQEQLPTMTQAEICRDKLSNVRIGSDISCLLDTIDEINTKLERMNQQ